MDRGNEESEVQCAGQHGGELAECFIGENEWRLARKSCSENIFHENGFLFVYASDHRQETYSLTVNE